MTDVHNRWHCTYGQLIRDSKAERQRRLSALPAWRPLRDQIELVCHSAELGQRPGFHLPHQIAAMDLHCAFADAEITGDLFAEAAARDLDHDLAFSGAQRFEALPQRGQGHLTLPPGTIASEAELD